MIDMDFNRLKLAAILYLLIGVACFGPATVQSEKARAEYQAKCRAEKAGDETALRWCPVVGPSTSDGLPKAVFWPLWISYTVASQPAKLNEKDSGK